MAKKQRTSTRPRRNSFDPETNRWFVWVAFGIFFLALVFLFSDFIFSDQMLHGSDVLQSFSWRMMLTDYFSEHGSVMQWMPRYFGGMPYVEAFHADIFYPLSFLKFIMPMKRALGWQLFLHIFFSGVFMYWAARQFRLSKVASLFSAASYMFAGYLISLVAPGHDGKIYVTTLFPLVILLADRGFEKKAFLNFSLLGLVIGFIILTPHAQMSYFTLWALSLFAAFKLINLWRDTRSIKPLIKPAVLTTYAVVIGLLLSAIQFWPGYYYTTHFSPRSDTKKGWEWATSWSMHEEEAMGILIPEFSGVSSRNTETYYWGKNPFKDNSEAVGVASFFLALLGFLFARRRKSYFFGGLALFALIYALGSTTPVFRFFYWLIPKVNSLRAPAMIMFMFSFSTAILAGMGIQRLIDSNSDRKGASDQKFNYVLLGFPAFMFVLALLFTLSGQGMMKAWCWLFYSDASSTMVQQGVSKFDVALANLPAVQSGVWFGFLFTAVAALCIWLFREGKFGVGALVALVAIPVVDGIRFDRRFVETVDESRYNTMFQPNQISNYLSELDEEFRVLNLAQPNDNSLLPFGIDAIVGYHGNQLRWYDDMLGGPALTNIRAFNKRFLNLAGAKYLVNPTERDLPADFFGPQLIVTVVNSGRTRLYRNDNAFPRVFLVDQYRVFEDRKDIVREVLHGTDDMRKLVYLEEEPVLEYDADSLSTDSVWIKDYQIEGATLGVQTDDNSILIMTDNYYDAWHVEVDGRPVKLLRTFGTFRGVEIPAGSKEVSFRYESKRYQTARMVTWLTMIYLAVMIPFLMFRESRKRKRREVSP